MHIRFCVYWFQFSFSLLYNLIDNKQKIEKYRKIGEGKKEKLVLQIKGCKNYKRTN